MGGIRLRHILVEIVCRQCGYHTHIKSHTLILPDLEPRQREQILNDTMFTFTCPSCQNKLHFLHNFLYHDPKRHFLAYMSSQGEAPHELKEQFPHALLVQVHDPLELKEAILISEDDLDHTLMQKIKALLKQKDPDVLHIRYHDYDADSETIWLDYHYNQATICKAIARSTYERLKRQWEAERG